MPIKKRRDNYEFKNKLPRKTYLMPTYNKQDQFKFYYQKHEIKKNQANKLAIKWYTYSKIIDSYNLSLIELLKSGVKVKLPYTLGDLQVLKVKQPLEKYDIKPNCFLYTAKEDFVYVPVLKWYKRFIRIVNKNYYSFSPARNIKNSIKKMFYESSYYKQIYDL